MITSRQIREHSFDTAENGGYTADSVNEYMELLAQEFDSMFNENREIIKRLSVFAKKIEEYKNNEGVVADTMFSAQKSAAQTVADAEEIVSKMIETAKSEGRQIIGKAKAEADEIRLDRDKVLNEAQITAKEMTDNAAAAAKKESDKIIAKANEQEAKIIADAEKQAEQIIADARKKAEQTVADAEKQASEKLAQANAETESIKEKAAVYAQNIVSVAKGEKSIQQVEAADAKAEAVDEEVFGDDEWGTIEQAVVDIPVMVDDFNLDMEAFKAPETNKEVLAEFDVDFSSIEEDNEDGRRKRKHRKHR